MTGRSNASSALAWIFVAFTALMCALAFGAVWALLASMLGRDLPWLGLAAAGGMVWSIHSTAGHGSPAGKAVLAALGTLLAAFYNECLAALIRLSGELGLPLLEVLQHAGFGSAAQLGQISIHQLDVVWYLTAAALAFLLGWYCASARTRATHALG